MPRPPRRQGLSTLAVTGGATHRSRHSRGAAARPDGQLHRRSSARRTGCATRATATRLTPRSCSGGSRCSRERRQHPRAASGMGATACALLALLRPGDHLLASSWIYGGTRRLFDAGVRDDGHRCHARRSDGDARLAQAHAQGDARDLPRVAGQPDVPRDRPAPDQLSHEGRRTRARRRLDVREPDQLPPAWSTAPTS